MSLAARIDAVAGAEVSTELADITRNGVLPTGGGGGGFTIDGCWALECGRSTEVGSPW